METAYKKRRLSAVAMSALFFAVLIFATRESHGGEQPVGIDAHGRAHYAREFKGRPVPSEVDVTKVVAPEYPYDDRRIHREGRGVFRFEIDPKTGAVLRVSTVLSTGAKTLDESALTALRQWRWKPGTWRRWDMPVIFTLTGKRSGSDATSVRPFGDRPVSIPSHAPAGITR